jgi:hypothetical protein
MDRQHRTTFHSFFSTFIFSHLFARSMAAQAFLGSEIALISKSDVRYTGILREVDIPNSRVCLQFCRSHGTEGRRGNMAEELAPSPQIYDYVVFRASDIKDLYVLRTPTAAMQQQDPAIVNVSPFTLFLVRW